MEKVLLNFSLFLIFVYFYRITRHGLHILQLENYYISRYAKWMKRCITKVLNITTIILLLSHPKMCCIGKILGSRIIFIESFANINTKTITGKLLYPISDKFIIQWESLKELYPDATFGGWIF